MKINNSVLDLIGKTPMLRLNKIEKNNKITSEIYAKLEYFNPAGSIKDRVAKAMIEKAEKDGVINENSVIIEPTSGNTGIGLASISAFKGYKVILTMPESMSIERRKLLSAYGAQIVLTEASKGMQGAIDKALELIETTPNSFMPSQFENEVNPKAHYESTAKEIWDDLDGQIDILVAGIGTGGTISGVGKYLKEKNPNIKVVAVEPFSSPFLSKAEKGPHKIQGIGAGFIPKILDTKIYDEIVTVSNDEAVNTAKEIALTEGILVGISSGAALHAAKMVSQKYNMQKIVVIFPDTGERYLSNS